MNNFIYEIFSSQKAPIIFIKEIFMTFQQNFPLHLFSSFYHLILSLAPLYAA